MANQKETLYRGRPVEGMSREELESAVRTLQGSSEERTRAEHSHLEDMLNQEAMCKNDR